MRLGTTLAEQAAPDGGIALGPDEILTPAEIFAALAAHFPLARRDPQDPTALWCSYRGHDFALRAKNVTYLGRPHALGRKRIQIPPDLPRFCARAQALGATPLLLGVYSFSGGLTFVSFGLGTYLLGRANNSSAHVQAQDLAAARADGYFQKVDAQGNLVTAFRADLAPLFLDEELRAPTGAGAPTGQAPALWGGAGDPVPLGGALPWIRAFFSGLAPLWRGEDCYREMMAAGYRNRFQPEWAGFYLEFLFERYIQGQGISHLVRYAQDKAAGGIDLDLIFPVTGAYGDLKAHSSGTGGIQGNDLATVRGIIGAGGPASHVYYLVLEHLTERDSAHGYAVTRFWNLSQGKADPMSYSTRMKALVRPLRMHILDINRGNACHLSTFRQGLNSNGRPRAPKIMVDEERLGLFTIDRLDLGATLT
ncbi:MAG: hypothetical protein K6A65_05600 [Succinivibrionaceae bacterium]|nr:hypothetical protein [Succinivibrionaceae bacterium]